MTTPGSVNFTVSSTIGNGAHEGSTCIWIPKHIFRHTHHSVIADKNGNNH